MVSFSRLPAVMFKEHQVFHAPDHPNVKIWLYMDFTKLVSIFEKQSLFFARADKFDDPFEGAWTRANLQAHKNLPFMSEHDGKPSQAWERMVLFFKSQIRHTAINCWHMNEHESAAMWKLYLASNEGIAVQSTYQRLCNSFVDDETVYVGTVHYLDYDNEYFDPGNLFEPFVHKRKSFEHERELRALVARSPKGDLLSDEDTIVAGVNIRVDLRELIERIYIAPGAPSWFAEVVEAVVRLYGHSFSVESSQLGARPMY